MSDSATVVQQPWINSPANGNIVLHGYNRAWYLHLRLDTAMSHHDPSRNDRSNEKLFNRQDCLISIDGEMQMPTQEEVDAICREFPVPLTIADNIGQQTVPEFCATLFFLMFISNYTSRNGEGSGLFTGAKRYAKLEERARHAATSSARLFSFWGDLCRRMQVTDAESDPEIGTLRLLTASEALSRLVLKEITERPAGAIIAARVWYQERRTKETQVASFDVTTLRTSSRHTIVSVPSYSANSARHEIVREPSLWHLFGMLGLPFDAPLASRVALFYNGGDLKQQGSSGVMWLRKEICERYPNLALLSGSTDRFLLGESNLRVHSWVRCRENNAVLSRIGLEMDMSGHELLSNQTNVRHGSRIAGFTDAKAGMPVGFEGLMQGAEIVVRFSLTPYATKLEEGALAAAVEAYRRLDMTAGGQPARGYGLLEAEWIGNAPGFGADYEEHLVQNAESLRAGILDGTLGTGKVILTEGKAKVDQEEEEYEEE